MMILYAYKGSSQSPLPVSRKEILAYIYKPIKENIQEYKRKKEMQTYLQWRTICTELKNNAQIKGHALVPN